MIFDIYNPHENQEVTVFYVRIISDSLICAGKRINIIQEITKNKANKSRGIVVIQNGAAIKAKKAGYSKIILWMQGVTPEESFMRHHNLLRWMVISLIEKRALRISDFVFFVSNEMKKHYEKKYLMKLKENYFIMPCFNTEVNKNSYISKKVTNNSFVYAGSLAKWQCFEETVRVYKQIENRFDNSVFYVFTKDIDKAIDVLKSNNIMHYCVEHVSQGELERRMKNMKFGFCLRKNSVVNRVSTPTKLSNYVSSYTIPVFSSYIRDFYCVSKCSKYIMIVDEENVDFEKYSYLFGDIDFEKVREEYLQVYGQYYSKEVYLKKIAQEFRVCFGEDNEEN